MLKIAGRDSSVAVDRVMDSWSLEVCLEDSPPMESSRDMTSGVVDFSLLLVDGRSVTSNLLFSDALKFHKYFVKNKNHQH
jgi:hypothetical protein